MQKLNDLSRCLTPEEAWRRTGKLSARLRAEFLHSSIAV
jgi:hypothetical protein